MQPNTRFQRRPVQRSDPTSNLEADIPAQIQRLSAADAVAPVEVIGMGVQVGLLRKRMMKRSIEYGDSRNILTE